MKKLTILILLLGTGYASAAEFSGNVTLATDYRFRGISQLDRSPALQGGFDVATESGFYVGVWGSNVNFSEGALELDVYGGFAADINDNLSYDVGLLYYGYPHSGTSGNPEFAYYEVYGSFSFYGATLGLNYSPDYFAESDKFYYVYGQYSLPIGDNFSIDFHAALNQFDSKDAAFNKFGIGSGSDDSYVDYSVTFASSFGGFDFALAFIDTNLNDDECFGGSKICEATGVFSVSKSL
ncbi:MAG: TorF family putative porin [Proteobacteria bacterium]|nr:TorF family putative porin [Pseudomonadota bacterium]